MCSSSQLAGSMTWIMMVSLSAPCCYYLQEKKDILGSLKRRAELLVAGLNKLEVSVCLCGLALCCVQYVRQQAFVRPALGIAGGVRM